MNLIIPFSRCLCSGEKDLKSSDLSGDLNPDLGAVLHHSNYQANWELIIMWVDYKPVDEEMMTMQEFFINLK